LPTEIAALAKLNGLMETYKRGGYTAWDCKYHLVRVTKYRHPVLGGDVGNRCRELLPETARAHEVGVQAGSITRVHVHMLVSIPPNLSAFHRLFSNDCWAIISRAVQYLKRRSSHGGFFRGLYT